MLQPLLQQALVTLDCQSLTESLRFKSQLHAGRHGNVSHAQTINSRQPPAASALSCTRFVFQSKEISESESHRTENWTSQRYSPRATPQKSRSNLHSQGWKVLEDLQCEPGREIWPLNQIQRSLKSSPKTSRWLSSHSCLKGNLKRPKKRGLHYRALPSFYLVRLPFKTLPLFHSRSYTG